MSGLVIGNASPAEASIGAQHCTSNQTKTIALPTRRDIVVTVNTCITQTWDNQYEAQIKVAWKPGTDSDPINNAKFDGFSVYTALQLNNSTTDSVTCDLKSTLNGASSGSTTCSVYGDRVQVGDWTGDGSITYNANSDGLGNLPTWDLGGSPNYCEVEVCETGAPSRSDNLAKNVFFIHGYNLTAGISLNMNNYWGPMTYAMQDLDEPADLPSDLTHVWCYYGNDIGCTESDDYESPDGYTVNTPIEQIAADLAWTIFYGYTTYGKRVDIVAHSMGGLIAEAVLTGVLKHTAGFPPYLYVEDAVALETPFAGTPTLTSLGCVVVETYECKEMLPGSTFMNWLTRNPQSQIGTDWTIVGADDDKVIPPSSSVPDGMLVDHKIIYTSGQFTIDTAHMGVIDSNTGTKNFIYCDRSESISCSSRSTFYSYADGPNPDYAATLAAYYESYW